MNRRSNAKAAVLLVGLLVLPALAGAQVRVLLLPDIPECTPDLPARRCEGVVALVEALRDAGHEVTMGPLEYLWDTSNPPLDSFDVVVHLNGPTFHTPLPVGSQHALEEFVRTGGGFIGSQYNGYESVKGQQIDMPDLVLQLWPHPDNCSRCVVTWTAVPGQETHPMLEGVPPGFTFEADGHDAGPLVEYTEDPSTVLMTSPAGGPAVIVREFSEGRVVSFSSTTNTVINRTLQDPNIQRLYINAIAWAIASEEPTLESLQDAVDELADSGALNPIQEWILDALLWWADRFEERGRTRGAAFALEWFVGQVDWWIRTGELTEEEGRPLVDDARAIVAGLTG